MADPGSAAPRRLVRRGIVVGFIVVIVVGVAVAARLLSVGNDLSEARSRIDSAATALEDGRLADARQDLAAAQRLLLNANSTLHTAPDIQLIQLLPVARQNVVALRDTVEVALQLAAGGARVLDSARPLETETGDLEIPLRGGAIPLDVVAAARADLADLQAALLLPRSLTSPSRFVLPPIRDAQERVEEEVRRRQPQLASLEHGLALLEEMMGGAGDRRFLILVSNSAEMRGTGGMYLSYGELAAADGDMTLTRFGGIDEIALRVPLAPSVLGIPADELERWAGQNQTELWRNINLSPDFPAVAPRAIEMYEAATGLPVDGVIQVDPAGLGAILAGVGPVDVPGLGQVTAENAVEVSLNTAYTAFPDRDQRQEVLGDIAEAAFQRLVDGEYESLRPLGEALSEAALNRHIQLYTPRPTPAASVAFFGADGALPPPNALDYALLSVQNFAGNKLDYYIETSVTVTGRRPAGEPGALTVGVTVENTAPAGGQASYVFGPNLPGLVAGQYRSIVSLYVPTGTNLVSASGGQLGEQPVVDTEAGRTVVTYLLDLPAGTASAVTLELELPPRAEGPYEFTLVPVPRVRPTSVALDVDAGSEQLVRPAGPLLVVEQLASDRAEQGLG